MRKLISEEDIGDSVCCDWCSREYRGDAAPGGFLFGTYAICPACAPKAEADIKKTRETHLIKARCPPGMSYHAWVMQLRGGNNKIQTYSGERPEDLL